MTNHMEAIEAAEALSRHLDVCGLPYAFLGGFAVNMLGLRRTTVGLDVQIGAPESELREHVDQAVRDDPRFRRSVMGHLLFVASPNRRAAPVPIETLALGTLGLPTAITMTLHMTTGPDVRLLHPSILVLTKMERVAEALHSTHPAMVATCNMDLADMAYLAKWIVTHKCTVDFGQYRAAEPSRLYAAVHEVVQFLHEQAADGDAVSATRLARLKAAMNDDDWRRFTYS